MRAGRMDQYITVRRQVQPQALDASGAPVDAYEDFVSIWADVLDKSSRLMRLGESSIAEADYTMTVYDQHAIDTDMRVLWDGVEYQVVDYLRDGRNKHARILVKSLTR